MSEKPEKSKEEEKLNSQKNDKNGKINSEKKSIKIELKPEKRKRGNILIEKDNKNKKDNDELTKKEENNEENINSKKENIYIKEDKNKSVRNGCMITEVLNFNEKKEENPKKAYLKEKYPESKNPPNLRKAIKLGIKKTHDEIHKKFLEENLTLNNKTPKEIPLNLFINNKKLSVKNSRVLKMLKEKEKNLSFNISKLTSQHKMIESLLIPKKDIVGYNNREYNLKIIKANRENLIQKLENVNEEIKEIIITQRNSEKKEKTIPDYRILNNSQEEYNKHLIEIGKKSNDSNIRFRNKMKSSYDKREKEIDLKEKELFEQKIKNFKDKINEEKKLISERKKKNDELTNHISKLANEKPKSPENYIYYKLKENYEKKQKKLLDKFLSQKKEPVMRKNEFDELEKRVNEQKRLMEKNNEEKKKKLMELWLYRSQTLPSYHHPLIKVVKEEEKNKKRGWNELDKKTKECNDLEKRYFKPPKVIINEVLRKQIEDRKKTINKDNIRKLRIIKNNQRLKLSSIKPITRKNIEHQLSFNKLNKKNIKILKPIKISPPKRKDYLKDVISKTSRGRSPNASLAINFNNILEKNNNNVVESLITAREQIEKIDDKIKRKKVLLNMKDSYSKDVNLLDQVGKLLIDSVQSKINVLSGIYDKK